MEKQVAAALLIFLFAKSFLLVFVHTHLDTFACRHRTGQKGQDKKRKKWGNAQGKALYQI